MATPTYDGLLAWIDAQRDDMLKTLRRWSEISSGTFHLDGLGQMESELATAFAPLGADDSLVSLAPAESIDGEGELTRRPLGRALLFSKRPHAAVRVLLSIHYDTVFAPDGPFQRTEMADADTLRGPGVVDAKGGIIVLLTALTALERSELAEGIGWEVLLNPDEEIGSPGSATLLAEAARRNHVGLVFEPAFADGTLVGARKGSGNYTVVVRGRSAHAGRDFEKGRNAIDALAQFVTRVEKSPADDVIINCGQISGGGPAINIVPDLAIARFNVRVGDAPAQRAVDAHFESAAREMRQRDGIDVSVHGGFSSPPKPLDERSRQLMDAVIAAGAELGLSLSHRPSGGTCDGNKLAAAGLAVVDSLGPVGGELHSDREYVRVSSLAERAKLTALLLLKLAAGEIQPPR